MRKSALLSLILCAAMAAEAVASSGSAPRLESQDPNRVVRIAVLQAGTEHNRGGNPGCEANFKLLAGLAREAAKDKPDLIAFPEYAISGWTYPSERVINGLTESIPGEGPRGELIKDYG